MTLVLGGLHLNNAQSEYAFVCGFYSQMMILVLEF